MPEFDFSSIEPYNEKEVPAAINRLAHNSMFKRMVRTMNPKVDVDAFMALMEVITTCDELQYMVMRPLVHQIVKRSMTSFTFDGLDGLDPRQPYLFVSNHRDITLDAGLLDVALMSKGMKTPEIGFGNNLMKNEMIVDLFRLNKMFTIIRGGSRREFYNNSLFLSHYIRHVLNNKHSSVWIAQRNGRTKDGDDRTDQGLLKMFNMSGSGDFETDINSLPIVPVAVSYEYEPCDILKAITVTGIIDGFYEKTPNEDVISMMMGISQQKGDVHMQFCQPITEAEVAQCASLHSNERFAALAALIDSRIHRGYKLHRTNYIAADLMNDTVAYDDNYTTADMETFVDYLSHATLRGPSEAARERGMDILLSIYAKPVENQMRYDK